MEPSDSITPTSIRILWRYVIPVAVVALIVGATWMSTQRHTCRSYCLAHGFHDARYTPPGRGGTPQLCHCLTREESAIERRVPEGKQVFPWQP